MVLHNVNDTGCNACTLFGLNFASFLNSNASVGDNRLFKVNVYGQECTVIQFVNELTKLRDGYHALSNGLTQN